MIDIEEIRFAMLAAEQCTCGGMHCSVVRGLASEISRCLLAEVERLRAELDHLTKNAGTDSCADYAARNAELTAEVERLRKVPQQILHIYGSEAAADNVIVAKMVRVAWKAFATSPLDTDTVTPAPRSRED